MLDDFCDHTYSVIQPKIDTELRARCTLCGHLRIISHPGQSDDDIFEDFEHATQHKASYEEWVRCLSRVLIREYEKETRLPYFVGSKDYAEWLAKRMK
jgi:hypothetical protein